MSAWDRAVLLVGGRCGQVGGEIDDQFAVYNEVIGGLLKVTG